MAMSNIRSKNGYLASLAAKVIIIVAAAEAATTTTNIRDLTNKSHNQNKQDVM